MDQIRLDRSALPLDINFNVKCHSIYSFQNRIYLGGLLGLGRSGPARGRLVK